MSRIRFGSIAVFAGLVGCSTPAGIPFHAEEALLDSFEWDSGLVPEGSPAQVRVAVRGGGGITVDATGNASGDTLTAIPGSGALQSDGSLVLEVHAKVDVASIHFDGLVEEVSYEIPAQRAAFDPFLLDGESTTLETTLPAGELLRAPIPSIPGSTLVLSIEGGTLTTEFAGTCASARAGYAEYLGRATIGGTVSLSATIEIEVPFVGSESFGPFAIEVPIPPITRDVDLGLFEVSGARVESGPSPCSDVPDDGGGVLGDGAVVPSSDGGVPFDGDVRPGDGGVRECIGEIEAPVGQACDYATAECLSDAGTPEQGQACFDADGAPELCADCLRDEFQSCATAERCGAAHQTYGCCARDHCATLTGDRFYSCLDAFCVDQRDTLSACLSDVSDAGVCPVTALCFRAPR